jgi:hypothetical protein
VDILFCDGCDGSISKRDVDEGNVVEVGGKTFHRKCMPGRPSRLLALLPWLLLLPALAGGVLVGTVLSSAPAAPETRAAGESSSAVETRVDALEAEVRGLSAQLQTTLDVVEERMDGADRALGRLDDGLGVLGQDLDRVVRALERLALNVAKLGAAREATADRAEVERRNGLSAVLEAARSADFGERFGALFYLAIRPEPEALGALRKALTDPEGRIRAYACELLGQRGDADYAGDLVAMLRDEEGIVRDAAHRALLLISGMPFEFDATAPAEKREEQARNWEKWWADQDETGASEDDGE